MLLCVCLVRGEEPKMPGEFELVARFGPLSIPVNVISHILPVAKPLACTVANAYGEDITVMPVGGKLTWKLKEESHPIKSLPTVIRFGPTGNQKAISIFNLRDDELGWAPHWGAEISVDGVTVCLLDADGDGKISSDGSDGICGPDAAVAGSFMGDIWSGIAGYSIRLDETGGKIKVLAKKLPLPLDGSSADLTAGWSYFNTARQRAGSPPVKWSDSQAAACRKHAEYCANTGQRGHGEDPANRFYSEDGARAGRNSNLGFMYGTYRECVIEQFRTVYHAEGMLFPGLKSSGMALVGKSFAVDIHSDRNDRNDSDSPVIFIWPPHGATGVFTGFNPTGEAPMPIIGKTQAYDLPVGQAVFAKVKAKGGWKLGLATEAKPSVNTYNSDPTNSATDPANYMIVCALPQERLAGNTEYTAILRSTDNPEKPFYLRWSFKTGNEDPRPLGPPRGW